MLEVYQVGNKTTCRKQDNFNLTKQKNISNLCMNYLWWTESDMCEAEVVMNINITTIHPNILRKEKWKSSISWYTNESQNQTKKEFSSCKSTFFWTLWRYSLTFERSNEVQAWDFWYWTIWCVSESIAINASSSLHLKLSQDKRLVSLIDLDDSRYFETQFILSIGVFTS